MDTFLASLAMATMLAPAVTRAEEMSYSALMARIDALEEQLHAQHADFVAYEMGGAQTDDHHKGNGKGKGKYRAGPRSIYISWEATVLRPYISSNAAVALGSPGFGNDYGIGNRFTIGTQKDNGVGGRFRYWLYNHGHAFDPPGATTLNLDLDVIDSEVTLSEELGNFDILLSGGTRYGRVGISVGVPELYFEGYGPTASIEASRDVGWHGVYLIGNMRASLLIGEIHDNGVLATAVVDDEIVTMLESQMGVGWSRQWNRGEMHLRAMWETQFWLNDTLANPAGSAFGVASNLGLSGAVLALEFRR